MILSFPYSGTRFRIIFFREQARARLSNRMKKKFVLAALELVGDGRRCHGCAIPWYSNNLYHVLSYIPVLSFVFIIFSLHARRDAFPIISTLQEIRYFLSNVAGKRI